MIAEAAALLHMAQGALALGLAVLLRIGAAMALLPAFGERVVPVRVRLVLALSLTAILAPALAGRPGLAAPDWPRLLASETVIGLALGAVLRLFVTALQMAGAMAAQATSLSQIFGTQAADPMPAIGHVFTIAGLAALTATGLHVRIVEFLLLSYDLLPPGRFPQPADMMDWSFGQASLAFGLAFTLAAPFLVASVLYNVTLGVINRAMPQLMVAFVGAPAITAAALVILALALPGLLEAWLAAIGRFLADPFAAPP